MMHPRIVLTNCPALCYGVAVKTLAALALFCTVPSLLSQTTATTKYQTHIDRQIAKVYAETAPSNNKARFHANWNSLENYRTPDWFRDAKFGIFIHWGVYSVPAFGNEWYSRNMYIPSNAAYKHQIATYGPLDKFGYKDFIPLFKAEHFDPDAWITLFQKAGARYIVPVAEHCDGFAMYASAMTPYNAAVMGPHRDVVDELARATRAHGLHFGVSSHTAEHWWWYGVGNTVDSDVRNRTAQTSWLYGPAAAMALPSSDGSTNFGKEPDPNHLELWLPPDKSFLDAWLARSTELVDDYHPDFIYFDWWIGQPAFKSYLQQFAAYYYDRSAEQGRQPVLTYKEEAMPPNTATLDIERGKLDTLRLLPWQTDTSISVHSWGYVKDDEYRTAPSLLQQLVDTVAKNGNLLLNVGPKSDGTIPEQARTVLLQIGAWLHINGEAIYNSRPFAVFGEGPTKALKNSTEKNKDIQSYTPQDIRYTTSSDGRILYAAIMAWPTSNTATMHVLFRGNPYLPAPICSVDLLGSSAHISFEQLRDGLHVTLPSAPPPNLPGDSPIVLRMRTTC
ncbi:alpha-L-fucosidase [Edaphobacter dinghuensis]|uniref:alpha-L-fucosidase n=1 Tax=Edaphobacter dinghuensis TaxID=1560005 RepID=A0A917HNC3_9BACT|nr:alpha-L-fucosidase [Edaphobacter dinghuensis]GGG84239.1 alpha-L-fucosidase [Edaphobacter dinghuensis]